MTSSQILPISPCCQPAQLVVDKYCGIFNIFTIDRGLWDEPSPQEGEITVSVSPDSAASATVRIIFATGPQTLYVLQPGQSRTDVFQNATTVFLISNGPQVTTGEYCLNIYRKFK